MSHIVYDGFVESHTLGKWENVMTWPEGRMMQKKSQNQ